MTNISLADWRALCVELVDIATAHCHPDDDAVGYCAAVLSRAHAALAQPEPVAPTDEELASKLKTITDLNVSRGTHQWLKTLT
jgi:hypothetical protein